MKKKIKVYGPIVPNNYKWYYDFLGEDYVCPRDVQAALDEANGEDVEVYINSPGGSISAGSEIYTILKEYQGNVKIKIVGNAHSAASVIAMARHCAMSPTALMMVHRVSTYASGNVNDMNKAAEILETADEALANAYMAKAGMSMEEVLEIMDKETWLTAEQAKARGLIDEILFEDKEPLQLIASGLNLPTKEQLNKVKALVDKQVNGNNKPVFLAKKLQLLKLKGEIK